MDWARRRQRRTEDIASACHDSLRRLRTDVIDLYQIHWPNRNAPSFGAVYFDPTKDRAFTSIHDQLQALTALVRAGKVRHIGLSNETPWGLSEFVRVAETHGLARVISVQNPYTLVNRVVDGRTKRCTAWRGAVFGPPPGFCTLTGGVTTRSDEARPQLGRLARFARHAGGRAGVKNADISRATSLAREAGHTDVRPGLRRHQLARRQRLPATTAAPPTSASTPGAPIAGRPADTHRYIVARFATWQAMKTHATRSLPHDAAAQLLAGVRRARRRWSSGLTPRGASWGGLQAPADA
jgi:hypothetical protein